MNKCARFCAACLLVLVAEFVHSDPRPFSITLLQLDDPQFTAREVLAFLEGLGHD